MGKIFVVDASGSMGEEGKKSVIRYLIQAITGIMEERYPKTEYEILCWNNQIIPYEGKSEFEGIAEAGVFEDFLGKHQKDTILLIGDGNYSDDVKRVLKSVDNKLMYLMLGCECNRSRLIKLVPADNLYETVDIVTCVDDFMSKT